MEMSHDVSIRVGSGLIAGAGIAAVDNFAFGGEVSPIVIVGMLLVFGGVVGMLWEVAQPLPLQSLGSGCRWRTC